MNKMPLKKELPKDPSQKSSLYPPLIFNVFKPARMTSYDVVRHFKRNLPRGYGKIGHFGTLDPFASGVLMIGIAGAARLNDLIHEYLPKTYLAIGKLGFQTPTGDFTSEVVQQDQSAYLRENISQFSREFIEQRLQEKFEGEYWQSPHQYSATKFMGKNLHQWAREGVEIKKDPVRRFIHQIQVVKYSFPYLCVRVEVSSGTYVRTLFQDFSHDLGTIGTLLSLVREKVGPVDFTNALHKKDWPKRQFELSEEKKTCEINKALHLGMSVQDTLPFSFFHLNVDQSNVFKNGGFLKEETLFLEEKLLGHSTYSWIAYEGKLLGLAEKMTTGEIKAKINFSP